jgi:hypothetical protein
MSVTLQQTEKLLCENHSFSQLGFSMMIMRMKTQYAKNPTPSTIQAYTDEINAFLRKFAVVMKDDYSVITKM